jgi:hypothetical protein
MELDAIYARFGYVANRLVNTVMSGSAGLSRIRAIQESLRREPPAEVAGMAVVSCDDLLSEDGWLGPIKSGTDAAARNVLVLTLADDSRVIIRPSGTEPKNKIYIEVPGTTPSADLTPEALEVERERCERRAAELGRAFERLMLARVGIELPNHALAVSGLVGLDHKQHFAQVFLPELAERARIGGDLAAFIDESLKAYGRDPRDLVSGGVAEWLVLADLPATAASAIRRAFRLSA